MPWLRRSQRARFTGWIAGLGTDSGHRVVVGRWHTSPYGPVTDALVEDPSCHRTLYAPTAQLAWFIIAARATLHDRDLGSLQAVHPPVGFGFGFGSVPRRPSLVQITTMIEAVGPGALSLPPD
jgi:hypothetical protein